MSVEAHTTQCLHSECYQPSAETVSFLESLKTRINSPVDLKRSEDGSDVADGVNWTVPTPLPRIPFWSFPNATSATDASWAERLRTLNNNATVETHEAIPVFASSFAEAVHTTLLDDYPPGIPANKMGDCLEGIAAVLDSTEAAAGLRSPVVVRFVGKEDALLSASRQGPIMRMDFNDLLYYNRE